MPNMYSQCISFSLTTSWSTHCHQKANMQGCISTLTVMDIIKGATVWGTFLFLPNKSWTQSAFSLHVYLLEWNKQGFVSLHCRLAARKTAQREVRGTVRKKAKIGGYRAESWPALPCLPRERRQQAAATPLHQQQDRVLQERGNNSNFSFMQAGTWSPKAASRQREIREKPCECRRINGSGRLERRLSSTTFGL